MRLFILVRPLYPDVIPFLYVFQIRWAVVKFVSILVIDS